LRLNQAEEIVLQGCSGIMHMTGESDKSPLAAGPALCQYAAGQHAYVAILLALYRRERSGKGEYIDISMLESALEYIEITLSYALQSGTNGRRGGHRFIPWDTYDCADGYATVIGMPARHWHRAAALFDDPRLFAERFDSIRARIANRQEYDSILKDCVLKHQKRELFHAGQALQLAFGYIADIDEVMASPQHAGRGFLTDIDHPATGVLRYCDAPFKMSATPWRTERAPLLGEHTDEVLGSLRSPSADTEPAGGDGESQAELALPLAGVRVIDLSHSWAAPHCSRILADFGAEVIKVEYVKRLCLLRGANTVDKAYDRHPGWLQVNRGKYSVTLDLTDRRERDVFLDLVRVSDVVIQNSRPGVMEKLGLGYAALTEARKDIIVVSMSAFGDSGPYSAYGGYGAVMEGVGGIQSLTAYEKGAKPVRIKELDITNGLAGACAVMTALLHRRKSGNGQYVDLSQLEAGTHALIGEHLLEFAANGTLALPFGNRHPVHAPQGCYPCMEPDTWAVVTVRSDAEWREFCICIGQPELALDERFATRDARQINHDALDDIIRLWSVTQRREEFMQKLQARGLAAGAVLDPLSVISDVHLKSRGYFMHDESGTSMVFLGMPFRARAMQGSIRWPGPALGQHNEMIQSGLLGRPPAEIRPVALDQLSTAFDQEWRRKREP
jgi:crotonobetainyl-CoA:carnitine CoA-transferase CaiB-like acyl-CoA transferase